MTSLDGLDPDRERSTDVARNRKGRFDEVSKYEGF